jgi:hypothetical protein
MTVSIPVMPKDVAKVMGAYPPGISARLLKVRQLIFETAAAENVGPLTETLKWGEPAYLTEASKSGTTIRLGLVPSDPDGCAIYFNCKTTLVDTFRTLFADDLTLSGNRAIMLGKRLPEKPLRICIGMALTYHRTKRRNTPEKTSKRLKT